MNWKEHANLFVNGKFKVKRNETGEIFRLIGIKEAVTGVIWLLCEDKNQENHWQYYNDCTLIARRISDMSDEEWRIFNEYNNFSGENRWAEGSDALLYALSIGVYPFDQSHFDLGEVIDVKNIKF